MGRYLPWFNILGIITSHSTLFDQGIHCVRRAGVSTSQEFLGILSFCDKIWLVQWLKNFQKRYMYFYLPHPQSSALTSLMASKTNPKAKRAIFMLNIILVNSYFVLVGDRNQSHTKSSDFGLFIVIRTLGGFNIVHSNAPQLKIFFFFE